MNCKHTGKEEISILQAPFGKVQIHRCHKCNDIVRMVALFDLCPRCQKPFPLKRGKRNTCMIPLKPQLGEQGSFIWKHFLWCCSSCAVKILSKITKEVFEEALREKAKYD